jgi:hypothetical protein
MNSKKLKWVFAFFSIIVFALLTLRIALTFPDYFSSLDRNYNPDAMDYGNLAKNIIQTQKDEIREMERLVKK